MTRWYSGSEIERRVREQLWTSDNFPKDQEIVFLWTRRLGQSDVFYSGATSAAT
jgi:hypothetical protein